MRPETSRSTVSLRNGKLETSTERGSRTFVIRVSDPEITVLPVSRATVSPGAGEGAIGSAVSTAMSATSVLRPAMSQASTRGAPSLFPAERR